MKQLDNNKKIVIVSHKFVTHPDDELTAYLNQLHYENVLHIRHSFHDAPDRRSFYTWYKKGEVYKTYKTLDYRFLPEPLLYLKEMYFTLLWIFSTHLCWDKYIGMDGLCVLFGNILKKVNKITHSIYWAIDFVPENRFSSQLKNKIYHLINIHGYKNSDEMWDLSPRMKEARGKWLGLKDSDYKVIKVVPYGVWLNRIQRYSYRNCEKNTLVFMGNLLEKQGAQLIIEALPELVQWNRNFCFKIIGGGNYEKNLRELADKLKVTDHCTFLGKVPDIKKIEEEIALSCLAIAPYIKKLDTWTYYADPGKVKTYLACGVPVLLTDLPWNAQDIEKAHCGKIISESKNDIISNIKKFMEEKKNQEYRQNAVKFAQTFNYQNIFDSLHV